MAKKEEPALDQKVEKLKVKAKKQKQPDKSTTKGNVTKVETSMKKPVTTEQSTTKVDLSKPLQEEKVETETVVEEKPKEAVTEVANETEVQPEKEDKETPALEEVTDKVEEEIESIKETITESVETGKPLPENIEKLVSFMEETGGDINDYVKLNRDYSEMDNLTLLKEYYKESKPHLNDEEINFMMEDNFSYEEDVDDDKDIRRKKLALKEQVANAKSHLDGQKSKYYEEIKAGSKLTKDQQKAIDFFNRYNKEEEGNKKAAETKKNSFLNKTKNVFNDKFKGFEYNVGEKNYRVNVSNANEVKDEQSDINNFIKKFLNENGEISDAKGYHKSLYTAMNADAVAKHFYEQGKTDAINNSITNSKNIDMSPRQSHSGEINAGGMKVKVLGDDSSSFKFKIKNKNK